MTDQGGMYGLWEQAEALGSREAYVEQAGRQKTRQEKLKRLRAGKHWQMVLAAARQLPQPFTLNDLTVALWKEDPGFFGMKGYPQYPDNHVVHTYMYGERGLVANGLIERVEPGLFRVPGEGLKPNIEKPGEPD